LDIKQPRHPSESRDPGRKPAFKIVFKAWIPAFAGMTLLHAGMTLLKAMKNN